MSNNPCIDAILAEIADPSQIGAVSAWSHVEASGSAPLDWARRFPAIGAEAEAVILARPKLALTGAFGSTEALDRAGVRYVRFGVPGSVAESIAQVREVATAIGRVEAGERLVGRMEGAVAPLPFRGGAGGGGLGKQVSSAGNHSSPAPHPNPVGLSVSSGGRDWPTPKEEGQRTAIIWLSGGFVPGKGTLQDELLARAGFRNANATYGLKQWDVLPLEALIRTPPDVIFTPVKGAGDGARTLALRARVLAKLSPAPRIVAFPERLLNCGGPSIVAAMGVLSEKPLPFRSWPVSSPGRDREANWVGVGKLGRANSGQTSLLHQRPTPAPPLKGRG